MKRLNFLTILISSLIFFAAGNPLLFAEEAENSKTAEEAPAKESALPEHKKLKLAKEMIPFPVDNRQSTKQEDLEHLLTKGICGNQVIEEGEDCDDGNLNAGDGCSEKCLSEAGICGNGILEGDELCELNSDCGSGEVCEGCGCTSAPPTCESLGMASQPNQCASQGCYREEVRTVQQKNSRGQSVDITIACYACASPSEGGSGCCGGYAAKVEKSAGSCAALTGVACSVTEQCNLTCPSSHPNAVNPQALTRLFECCQCSSLAEGKCDAGGIQRSTSCGGEGLADLKYTASSDRSCSGVTMIGGGRCIAKCVGEGQDCGAG